MENFKIEIIKQTWLNEDSTNTDLCSHGYFKLIVGNIEILNNTTDLEFTISTSTLNLLRTIESNHIATKNFEILIHCGMLTPELSCPVGIYWDLKHKGNKIEISNITKQFGVGDLEKKEFKNLKIEILKTDYIKDILIVAKNVKLFFNQEPERIIDNEFESKQWDTFWKEFNYLYQNALEKYS
jgi:hypothetical protein